MRFHFDEECVLHVHFKRYGLELGPGWQLAIWLVLVVALMALSHIWKVGKHG